MSPAVVSFETCQATNLKHHVATTAAPSARPAPGTLHYLDRPAAGALLHSVGLCFPCLGEQLCWEHQEAQTAGRSLGSGHWLACAALQACKMQIKSLLGFPGNRYQTEETQPENQHRETQPAADLGLLTSICISKSGNPLFFSTKHRGFFETQERGRTIA